MPQITSLVAQQQGGLVFTSPSKWIDNVALVEDTEQSYNLTAARAAMGLVAGQPLFVIFSADGPFWANFHGAAAIPSGDTTNGSSSEFTPNQRYLDDTVTAIGLIAAANQNVSIQFYIP